MKNIEIFIKLLTDLGWTIKNGELYHVRVPKYFDYSLVNKTIDKIDKPGIYLIILALCRNIYLYGQKDKVKFEDYLSWISLALGDNEDFPNMEKMAKYRWDITEVINRGYPEICIQKITPGKDVENISPNFIPEKRSVLLESGEIPFSNNSWVLVAIEDLSPKSPMNYLYDFFPELGYFFPDKNLVLLNILKGKEKWEGKRYKEGNEVMVNFLLFRRNGTVGQLFNLFYISKLLGIQRLEHEVTNGTKLFLTKILEASYNTGLQVKFYNVSPPFRNLVKDTIKARGNDPNYKFNIMTNIKNSCYMDSVLFPIFYTDIPLIRENILEKETLDDKKCENIHILRGYLKSIYNFIHKKSEINYCVNFRKEMGKCNTTIEFASTEENDSEAFLRSLFDIFNIEGVTEEHEKYYIKSLPIKEPYRDSLERVDIVKVASSPINNTAYYYLQNLPKNVHISNLLEKWETNYVKFIPEGKDKMYEGTLTMIRVTRAPDLYIFNISRVNPLGSKIIKKVYPDESLSIGGKDYYLFSVIVHIGMGNSGHYITYFLYKKNWYLYDDLRTSFKSIGTFDNLLKTTDIVNNGQLFFYKT